MAAASWLIPPDRKAPVPLRDESTTGSFWDRPLDRPIPTCMDFPVFKGRRQASGSQFPRMARILFFTGPLPSAQPSRPDIRSDGAKG